MVRKIVYHFKKINKIVYDFDMLYKYNIDYIDSK